MLESLLVANRGEIACRIIRTARSMGLRTIAVYSDADREALHVRLADEALHIGAAPAAESYLDMARLIDAARRSGAAAVHPGYGFLAENADFAEACARAGIVFVGPPPAAIRAMGLKGEAKALMEKAGVPVVPGYHGPRQDPDFLRGKAYEIGYPVLIKAVAGGGGKGMRRVDKALGFDEALEGARREAQAAFGDGRVLIEKWIEKPRHIEIQVFGDRHGNLVHLFERDCSLQRRQQKVVEEAPAPGMTDEMRQAMAEAAIAAARAVGYTNAGTVEFIVDTRGGLDPQRFFFMEMNTRIQVEHPVTEMVTGLDLVEWQIRVAAGEDLPLSQDAIKLCGHAVEARLYAEDPETGFLPSTGRVEVFDIPEAQSVRVDTGVAEGGVVTPHYDPMIAKLVAHGADRDEALDRLSAALASSTIVGPRTNLGFLKRLLEDGDFRSARFDTGLIDRRLPDLLRRPEGFDEAAAGLGALRLIAREQAEIEAARQRRSNETWSPWAARDGFQLGGERRVGIDVAADGVSMTVEVAWREGEAVVDGAAVSALKARLVGVGDAVHVLADGFQARVARRVPSRLDAEAAAGDAVVRSPMHGRVMSIHVAQGEAVERGRKLAVIEAMKMEHTLVATREGTVAEISVAAGDQIEEGRTILVIRAKDDRPA